MYMIIDDFGTVVKSEQPKELLKQWIVKEIESIMNTVDENDYMNALMVTSMLYQYELKNDDLKKQFDDLTNIISNAPIRPGRSDLGSKRCEITALSVVECWLSACFCLSTGNISIRRSIVFAALSV